MHVDTVKTIGQSILPGPTPTSEYQLADKAKLGLARKITCTKLENNDYDLEEARFNR